MRELVCLVEEASAKELLRGLWPRILPPDVTPKVLVFQGKQDLERNVIGKLRGWRGSDTAFVILRDQDKADCRVVKTALADLAATSGRRALIRVACRQLEAWVAGDLAALARAYDAPAIADAQRRAKYRNPDLLGDPYREIVELLPAYTKTDGARRVGPLLDPDRNHSTSFLAFCRGVRQLYKLGG